jgi:hypothetical protein
VNCKGISSQAATPLEPIEGGRTMGGKMIVVNTVLCLYVSNLH